MSKSNRAVDLRSYHTKMKPTWDYILILVILTVLLFCIVFPFYNVLVISVSTSKSYALAPTALWPGEFTLENYAYLVEDGSIWVGYKNTLLVTVCGLIYGMTITTLTAYGFSHESFPGKKILFLLMMFTMFFGGGLVPTFLMMKNFNLINTHASIVLLGGVSTGNIIVMKSGFESTPESMREAARIDGANDIQTFWHVMLPLQKPLLATFSLFTIVGYWNAWYWPMMMLNTPSKFTLQLILRMIINSASNNFNTGVSDDAVERTFSQGIKMAAVIFTIAPVMCVYPFLQKHFAKGVMVGAIKM